MVAARKKREQGMGAVREGKRSVEAGAWGEGGKSVKQQYAPLGYRAVQPQHVCSSICLAALSSTPTTHLPRWPGRRWAGHCSIKPGQHAATSMHPPATLARPPLGRYRNHTQPTLQHLPHSNSSFKACTHLPRWPGRRWADRPAAARCPAVRRRWQAALRQGKPGRPQRARLRLGAKLVPPMQG